MEGVDCYDARGAGELVDLKVEFRGKFGPACGGGRVGGGLEGRYGLYP